MKNTIQIKYENILINNKLKEYISKEMKHRSSESGEGQFWLGRLHLFLQQFYDSSNLNIELSNFHFSFDFSINSTVSNYITSSQDGLRTYLDNLPGMPSDFMRKINEEHNNFQHFLLFCDEIKTKPEDVFFSTIPNDVRMLFYLNGFNIDDIRDTYLLKRDYTTEINQNAVFNNHGFLIMHITEILKNFLKNKEYKKLKSLISEETKHFFQSLEQDYRSEYFDFCLENEINPFYFKNESEETLINLNFQLA